MNELEHKGIDKDKRMIFEQRMTSEEIIGDLQNLNNLIGKIRNDTARLEAERAGILSKGEFTEEEKRNAEMVRRSLEVIRIGVIDQQLASMKGGLEVNCRIRDQYIGALEQMGFKILARPEPAKAKSEDKPAEPTPEPANAS